MTSMTARGIPALCLRDVATRCAVGVEFCHINGLLKQRQRAGLMVVCGSPYPPVEGVLFGTKIDFDSSIALHPPL